MSGAAFLRIAKLKGSGIIKVAVAHNRREIQAEVGASGSIDPARCHLNESLAGPASSEDVAQLARDLMAAAGVVKLRKDAVTGLEVVVSLPVGIVIDDRTYFSDCAQWAGDYFGCHVLSADIHRDEAAPHCHILILPLVNGRMIGNKLMGGRPVLLAMQKHFYDSVAARYGLRKAPARLSGMRKEAAAALVLARLRETGDSALQSQVWSVLRDAIEKAPETFLLALGMSTEVVQKPGKTMAKIFTSKGKGPKRETDLNAVKPKTIAFEDDPNEDHRNAIAFAKSGVEKEQRLCSVAFAQNPHPFLPPKATRRGTPKALDRTAQSEPTSAQVTLHRLHIAHLAELMGIVKATPDGESQKTIVTLTRRLHLLRDRIEHLDDLLSSVKCYPPGPKSNSPEEIYSGALLDLADEFCAELVSTDSAVEKVAEL